jgi:tetratricopeptide (TPR) repeat protein/CHAT domain-containing protein
MRKRLACCIAALLVVSVALAETPREELRALGIEGEKYFKDGSFRAARDRWEKGLVLARNSRNPRVVEYFLTNLGIVYGELGEYQKATSCANESLRIAEELKDRPAVAANFGSLGNAAANAGDYRVALSYYEKALDIFRETDDRSKMATALNNRGNVYAKMGDYATALSCYEQALDRARSLHDQIGVGNTLANFGTIREKRGEYREAVSCYEEALKVFREFNYRQGIGANLTNLGVLYNDRGDYQQSIACYDEALKIAKLLGNRDAAGDDLLDLGIVYKNVGDYWRSIEYYERALETFKDTGNGPKIMATLAGLGVVYAELGDFSKAMSYYEESLALADRQGDTIGISSDYMHLGTVCSHLEDHAKAIEFFVKAAELRRKAGLPVDEVAALIADTRLAQGDLDAAEKEYLRLKDPVRLGRLALVRKNYNGAIGYFSAAAETDILNRDAKSLFADYCGLGNGCMGVWDYHTAKENFEKAIRLAEEQREMLGEGDRSRFFSAQLSGFYRTEPYEGMVRALVNLKDVDGAFYYSENLKARVLLEAIARGHAQVARKIDSELAAEEERFTVGIRALRKEMESLFKNRLMDRYYAVEKELKDLRSQQDAFIARLRQRYPEYASVSYPRPLHLKEVGLRDNEYLLEFEVTDDRSYLFVVHGKRGVAVREILRSRVWLQEEVGAFRDYFENIKKEQDLAKFDVKKAAELFAVLFGNVLDTIPRGAAVIIVPDEVLGLLPFEALVVKAPAHENIGEGKHGPFPLGVEYLGDRYAVAYAQSATSLTVLRSLKKETPLFNKALVVCDPIFSPNDRRAGGVTLSDDEGRHLKRMGVAGVRLKDTQTENSALNADTPFPRLEKTREIGRNIEQLFGNDTVVFAGADAKEENIVNLHFEDYRYVIFATHGILDDTLPWIRQPALVLTQVGNRQGFDGFLTLTDVMGLKIPADVVALTACDTGVGKNIRGEGVMGMGKAFQFAGAGSVLMSLWGVSEDGTVALTNAFFKDLHEGKGAYDSLKAAREEMRRNGYEHPFYWASLILVTR